MDWYETDVRAAEQRRDWNGQARGRVVFYGSSSFTLWTGLSEDFAGIDVLNLAFGGSTLEACDYFFERLVVPARPRSLVLYAGDNDLGDGRPPTAVLSSLRALMQKLNARLGTIPFAFLSVKPSPARWDIVERIVETNRLVREEIEARPQSHFIDVFSPMLRHVGRVRPELFTEDGLHMNRTGYALWRQVLLNEKDKWI